MVYNSLNFWNLEVSNSLKKLAHQCASVDTLLASFEQKMSTKSSKIAYSGQNSILKGSRMQLHHVHSYFGVRHCAYTH
jgi:hypothetical protein